MRKLVSLALSALLLLSPLGCAGQDAPAAHGTDGMTESYYAGQQARAYKMFQKPIFQELADDWTGHATAAWDYDSFAAYQVLDEALQPAAPEKQLYACTYSADGGICGYIVLEYTGDGIGKVRAEETAEAYDLRAQQSAVEAALGATALDWPTAIAARVRCADGEAVFLTDNEGHEYLYSFAEQALL